MSQEGIKIIKEAITIIFVIAIIVGVASGIGSWAANGIERLAMTRCEEESKVSGFTTRFEDVCWMEIKPDLWVRADDILRYLHLLEEE